MKKQAGLGQQEAATSAMDELSIGRSNFHLNAVMTSSKKQVRAELYILGDSAKAFFALDLAGTPPETLDVSVNKY